MRASSVSVDICESAEQYNVSDMDSLVSIIVDDAKNEGFGPTKFTTYRITSTPRAGGSASVITRHRFSEFVALRAQMLESLPGVVIPPLPEKQVINRWAPEFVEKRRVMLSIFLQKLVDHPLAAGSEKAHAFLTWPEAMCASVLARHQSFRLPPSPSSDSVGDALNDVNKSLKEFEKQLGTLRERFKRIQVRQSDDGNDLHEASQVVKAMGENQMNSVLQIALGPFSEGLQALASQSRRQAAATQTTLLAKLKLHKMLAHALLEQFQGRDKVSAIMDATNAKIKDLLAQSTKLAGKPGVRRGPSKEGTAPPPPAARIVAC